MHSSAAAPARWLLSTIYHAAEVIARVFLRVTDGDDMWDGPFAQTFRVHSLPEGLDPLRARDVGCSSTIGIEKTRWSGVVALAIADLRQTPRALTRSSRRRRAPSNAAIAVALTTSPRAYLRAPFSPYALSTNLPANLRPGRGGFRGSFCRARRQTGCPFVTHNVTSRTSIAALRKVHSINALLAIRRAYSGVLIIRFHTLIVVSGGMRFRCSRVGVRNKVAESKSKNPSRRCRRDREIAACGSIQAARVRAKTTAASPVWRDRSPRLAIP